MGDCASLIRVSAADLHAPGGCRNKQGRVPAPISPAVPGPSLIVGAAIKVFGLDVAVPVSTKTRPRNPDRSRSGTIEKPTAKSLSRGEQLKIKMIPIARRESCWAPGSGREKGRSTGSIPCRLTVAGMTSTTWLSGFSYAPPYGGAGSHSYLRPTWRKL